MGCLLWISTLKIIDGIKGRLNYSMQPTHDLEMFTHSLCNLLTDYVLKPVNLLCHFLPLYISKYPSGYILWILHFLMPFFYLFQVSETLMKQKVYFETDRRKVKVFDLFKLILVIAIIEFGTNIQKCFGWYWHCYWFMLVAWKYISSQELIDLITQLFIKKNLRNLVR